MNKIIYIIPGLGENCKLVRYKKLARVLQEKGYKVNLINPNWYRPLSEQVFHIEKEAIILGFSFGAVLAYLIVEKYPCEKAIFASISPLHTLSSKGLIEDYMKHMSKELAIEITKDIKSIKISFKDLKTPFITLAGELEVQSVKKMANLLVPKTGHFITNNYISCIEKSL